MIRQINQDYYIVKNERVGIFPNLFLLADGVGSNRQSGFASKHCCDFVIDEANRLSDDNNYVSLMQRLYKLVNIDLYNRIISNPDYSGMGTTLVMTTIDNNKLLVGNIGDSRLYHIRGDITQVTRDHSLAENLVEKNQVERYSKKYYEFKNQLTRAIGAGRTIQPDFFEVEVMTGDYILMCSDGLSNMVPDQEIKNVLLEDLSLNEKVDKLVDMANNNGGKDNIAVILIYIDDIDKTKAILDKDRIQNNDGYKAHIEMGVGSGNKQSDNGFNINNLKVNIDDIDKREMVSIDEEDIGRSRKKQDDDIKGVINRDIVENTKYERKEGNGYDYEE